MFEFLLAFYLKKGDMSSILALKMYKVPSFKKEFIEFALGPHTGSFYTVFIPKEQEMFILEKIFCALFRSINFTVPRLNKHPPTT